MMHNDEWESIVNRHFPSIISGWETCYHCRAAWPCDAWRLVAEVRRLRTENEQLAGHVGYGIVD